MTEVFRAAPRAAAVAFISIMAFSPGARALAQTTSIAGNAANDPVERLGRYIRVLAGSPRDLQALLGAGRAALEVGDANAALGFFARAEEVAPTSGIAKAGLGSSLVSMERADDALRLFAQAVSLGVPEATVARDRGLAYDLRGDSRRAQRDYAMALAQGSDDELIRRYALSLGISGDRAAALQMLDPLLRKQDQGAWRARAFIMAMNGDVSGANGVARQLMVPAMANAMAPLLSRLATLNPAERAHAVNFGTVPADGTQMATVQTGDPYLSSAGRPTALGPVSPNTAAGAGLIPFGAPLGSRAPDTAPVKIAQPDSKAPRRRPDERIQVAVRDPQPSLPTPKPAAPTTQPAKPTVVPPVPSVRVSNRVGERMGPVDPRQADVGGTGAQLTPLTALPPPDRRTPPPQSTTSTPTVVASAPPTAATEASAPVFEVAPLAAAKPAPVEQPKPVTPTPPSASPTVAPAPAPVSTSSTPAQAAAATRLAGLLAGLQTEQETAAELPSAREIRIARAAARKKMADLAAQAAADKAAKEAAAAAALAAKKHPARVWVQVATGRNDSGLALTWKRIRGEHEKALKGQSAWSAPYKATNRILVGPMKSAAAARALVNTLAKDGISATTWSSEAGEEVVKIAAK